MTGVKRNALAFALGIGATLALPPFFALPLLILAFGGLYWLIRHAPSGRRAFADGWWWGWGFHISGLYWFCIALLTDPDKFAWLIPFALFALTAVIALYHGIACWAWKRIGGRGVSGIFLFSVVWTLAEYARGHLFSGFPWNLAGYSFTASDALMQLASLIGIYGLTWFAVFLGALPVALLDKEILRRQASIAVGTAYALLIAGGVWGASELQEDTAYVPDVRLRLVQANIAQHRKWEPEFQMQGLQEYVRLTRSPGLENITHVIWPETAVPYAIRPGTPLMQMLGSAVSASGYLITGVLRVEGDERDFSLFNGIVALNHKGDIVGSYDKSRLVPFGEFVPLRFLLPEAWLTPVGPKDFSRGRGAQTLSWPGLPPLNPLICYEVIFPEYVDKAARPQWLLNLTNDAWFGLSSGPYQHFHMARLRAVEQGVPLVRVANTGITAIVDNHGRIISRLGLEETGIIDSGLPAAKPQPTLYFSYGFLILPMLTLMALVLRISQRRLKNN